MQSTMHVYEVRPRKDHRGVDLISDVLPFRLRLDIVFDTVRIRVAPAIAIATWSPFARTLCHFTTCNLLESGLRRSAFAM